MGFPVTFGSIPQDKHVPSHPDILEVRFSPGEFQSGLFAVKDINAGARICAIEGFLPGTRTRTSFQCGEQEHLEFNSDLVFANHSCDPNMALNVSSAHREDWVAIALKDIRAGDPVTWFYPSTEWDAWGGGFTCLCGAENCVGQYQGSKAVSVKELTSRGHVNAHVLRLCERRDGVNVG